MPTCRGEQAEAAEVARVEAEAEAAERLKGGEQEAFLLKKKLELAQGGREQVGLILSCLVFAELALSCTGGCVSPPRPPPSSAVPTARV
eukprot:COSAG06_NODE_6996_length_2683_cov_6.186920_2_plen_89_part_00